MKPETIRNIALVGHGGAGKTSLADACLFATGAANRPGSVTDGTSVLDYTDEEKEKQQSQQAAICSVTHHGTHINIIDTPGLSDFCGHAVPALAATETAVVVVSATAGVEVNTRKMFERAREFGNGLLIVVNKIDADNVNLPEIVSQLQEHFGANCLPVNLPGGGGKDVVACLGGSGSVDFGDVEEAHTAVVEAVVGADDDLMERYLGGEVSDDEVRKFAALSVAKGELVPIVFTSARDTVGVTAFLDAVLSYAPSPVDGLRRTLVNDDASTEIDPNGPEFVGQVFKIQSDVKSNIKYSYVRIHSGTLRSDMSLHTVSEKKGMRPGQIYRLMGGEHSDLSEAVAGDIVALAKLDVRVGDVLFTGSGGTIAMPKIPTPMFSLAIESKARGDEDRIAAAFKRFSEEDPCFIMERNSATKETVIRGIGELHLRTYLNRLVTHYKAEVETHPPKIPYTETVTAPARDVAYTHKKQTGGAGQFGRVIINLEPAERGSGYEFVDKIFGGAIDQSFRPSVDKGIRAQMADGVLAGYPIVDVKVELIDGKTHPVDSKDIAFQIAGRGAFKEAFMKAKPILLEPVVNIEVTAPVGSLGDLQGDLASRRGQPVGQDMLPGQMALLKAKIPLSEVSDYHSRLSSITGGQGSYMMELSHYQQVPSNIQQRIVADSQNRSQSQ
ncbi:MAG: elongation factor G [Phycisphaerae bacterium]